MSDHSEHDSNDGVPPLEVDDALPSREEQKRLIDEADKPLGKEGEPWFLIQQKWWRDWKSAVGFDRGMMADTRISIDPVLDNSSLLDDKGNLKPNLGEFREYSIISEEQWELFRKWYNAGPEISRRVILQGFMKTKGVEIYPPTITLHMSEVASEDVVHQITISKCAKISLFKKEVGALLDIPLDQFRMWLLYAGRRTRDPLGMDEDDETLDEARVVSYGDVLIERKEANGRWPTLKASYDPVAAEEAKYTPGVCGLMNLGNTCFMNSALQCVLHTPELTEFCVSERVNAELNEKNPLGMRGEVALAYSDVVKQIWSGRNQAIAPRDFKYTIGQFAPRFVGFGQQDSQELLGFLLDGLHEDLNRCKEKPYVEVRDGAGREDADVAREAWTGHLMRNNSVIVDLFQGQFKSRVTCPEPGCGKVSITFDPFMMVPLPLPGEGSQVVKVHVMYKDPARKIAVHEVTLKKEDSIMDIKTALAPLVGLAANEMALFEIYDHRIFKRLTGKDEVSSIAENDIIFAYEVDPRVFDKDSNVLMLPFYHCYVEPNTYPSSYVRTCNFGVPLVVTVEAPATCDAVKRELLARMQRYVTRPERAVALLEGVGPSGEDDATRPMDVESSPDTPTADEFPDAEEWFDLTTDYDAPLADKDLSTEIRPEAKFKARWKKKTLPDACYNGEEAESCEKMNQAAAVDKPDQPTLRTCLDLFALSERLSEEDPWYCPKCQEFRTADKKMDLWKAPDVLVFHLKRFKQNRWMREKLDTFVDFPLEGLDMGQFLVGPPDQERELVYDLFAVSNHFGGLGGGHYTAYAKNHQDGKWYDFNDQSCQEIKEDEVRSKAAYMLFYRRRGSVLPPPRPLVTSMDVA